MQCEICGATHEKYVAPRKQFDNKILCYAHWYQLKYHGEILHTKNIYELKEHRFEFKGDIVEIIIYDKLYNEKCRAIIDSDDYDKVKDFIWWVDNNNRVKTDVDKKKIRLHWLISGVKKPDHINNNTLDNRKSNLRIVTEQQNSRNTTKPSNNTTGVKGVYWYKPQSTWKAQIKVDGKDIFLGYFSSFDACVKCRISEEAKIFKEYSVLYNFNTQTIQLAYHSHDDNLPTFIESDLSGHILTHHKLPQ